MTNISLRAYMREIEGLIDSGRHEETVFHCRHILQQFPKHIDTYRLLGKVFLEAKQFSNAADILQRVLSAVPDDFVSHIGMSIIREDEGNLDAAIWHMERAYESKPSNKAIQDELRRLFGRRDGVEPPKIRLTRGALARMYAKGNLYDQATAELRGALSEDPQRPDLQLLLAQMNYLSGNKVEAVETSGNLLKKFPYCLVANRILAMILPQTERAEDAKIYQQRAIALDPYLSNAGADVLTSDDVPDSAVSIETLEIKPGQPVEGLTEQPAWATSLGIKLEGAVDEDLPDWLTEDLVVPSYEGEQIAPFIEDQPSERSVIEVESDQELIPGWMQEAGWQPSTEVEGPRPPAEIGETEEVEREIEKGEIPDWLKAIAAVEAVAEAVGDDEVEAIPEDALPPWLDENPPGPTDSIISWLDEKEEVSSPVEIESQEEPSEEVEIPSWLQELEEGKEIEGHVPPEETLPTIEGLEEIKEQEAEKTGELTEWLVESPDQVSSGAVVTEGFIEPEATETLEEQIEWAESLEGEKVEELKDLPDWLKEIEPEIPPSPATEEGISEELDISDQLKDLPMEEEIEIPDWLISMDEGIEEESLFEETPGETAEIPEWLQELREEPDAAKLPEEEISGEIGVATEETSTAELQAKQELSVEEIEDLNQEMQDSALAWLESLAAKQGISEEELITRPEERLESPPEWILEEELHTVQEEVSAPPTEVEVPEWLKEVAETKEESEIIERVEIPEDMPKWLRDLETVEPEGVELSPGEAPEEESHIAEVAGLAWLESLAAKQGVPEEELITRPEERIDEPPAWVTEEIEKLEKPYELPIEKETIEEIQEEAPVDIQTSQPEVEEQLIQSGDEIGISPEVLLEPEIKVDLNQGSLSDLENIPGVGFVLAQNIVVYRDEHGPFKDIEDLKSVPGVDNYNFELIKDRLTIPEFEETTPVDVITPITELAGNKQFMEARSAVESGDYDRAFEIYDQIIKQNKDIEEVITVLESEISQYPDNIVLWQTLGDAYMRNDQFQKALEAYTKAEKLL